MRRFAVVMLALAVASPLAACGRKGKPVPPEGTVYPRQYPKVDFPDQQQNRQQEPQVEPQQ